MREKSLPNVTAAWKDLENLDLVEIKWERKIHAVCSEACVDRRKKDPNSRDYIFIFLRLRGQKMRR